MRKTQWPPSRPAKYLLTVGALAICYFAVAKAGLAFAIPPGNATAVWPASGIALAALLLLGFRVWPGIWLGAMIANLTTDVSLPTAIAMGTGNTFEAVLGAWLFCRFLPVDAPFTNVRDAFVFAVIAVVSCIVAAGMGASSLLIGGYLQWAQFAPNLSTWWLGDVAGLMIVVPLVLACAGRRWRVRTRSQWAEFALYVVLLGLVSQCVFGGWFTERLAENVLYVPMILLIWVSLRFSLVEVTLGTALLTVAAIWGTCMGVGAYSTEALQASLFDLQVFMNTYAITALAVVGMVATRRAAEQAVIESTASFEAVFNNAPVMMVLLDENRNVRAANAAAAEVLTGANSMLTDQRYGHAVQCVHSLNEPQGCGGKGACGSCGVRRIIDQAFKASTALRSQEVCLTRKNDGVVEDCYFLMSTSLPQIPARQEVLVCLEDITERKQIEEQIRTNLRMQEVINAILQSSLETASQVEFLNRTLDLLVSIQWLVLQKKGCVFLKDENSETLKLVAHRGLPDELTAACQTLPFGKCLCGRAAVSREILFVNEVDDRHEIRYPGMVAHGHYCVPIASEGRLYGVLTLYVDAGHRRIAEEEAFLASVSSVLAITLRRKEAELALRSSEQRFDLAVRGTDAGIWDWDTRTNEVYFSPRWKGMLGYGEDELSNDFSEWSDRLHPDDRERALSTVEDYLDGRKTEYELEHRLRHKDGTYRWILARGAAVRDATGKVHRMVGSHLDITSLKEAEYALREKEAELIAAAEIQNFLLPRGPVSVPGFSIAGRCYPTDFAAGDYFDYLWLPDGSFLMILADVTGHGLGPAIVTAAAHARIRALCENHTDLTQIVVKANAALHRETRDDLFLTLIAGRIDLESRELTYVNAGHPPAKVLDATGDVKASLEPTSMPLAIHSDLKCGTGERIPLADHDVVLFYTDGLVEAQSATGPAFGIDRALQVVRENSRRSAAEIIEALYSAVYKHAGTDRLFDDLTLVVLKVDQTD